MKARLQGGKIGGLTLDMGDSLTNFEDSLKDMGDHTLRLHTEGDKDSFGISMDDENFRVDGNVWEGSEVKYKDLTIGRRIGRGACSTVNIAENESTGIPYAIKMFNVMDREKKSQMLEEVKFLHRLNNECDSIVGMKGLFYIDSNVGIVLEYMDRGSLEFLSNPQIDLDHDQLAAITVQILWGLAYLHHPHVSRIHRDIKPANVLINSQGEVKLSDFGISKFLELDSTFSAKGSFRYMSPERLNGKEYNFSSDLWSVGILIIQLWTKVYPFYYCSNSPVDLFSEIDQWDTEGTVRETLSMHEDLQDVLMYMLEKDPSKRKSADWLLRNCKWFETSSSPVQNGDNQTDVKLVQARALLKEWLANIDFTESHIGTLNSSLKSVRLGNSMASMGLSANTNSTLNGSLGGNNGNRGNRGGGEDHKMHAGYYHANSHLDDILSDKHTYDHPYLRSPTLSRTSSSVGGNDDSNSNSLGNSLGNSVQTEIEGQMSPPYSNSSSRPSSMKISGPQGNYGYNSNGNSNNDLRRLNSLSSAEEVVTRMNSEGSTEDGSAANSGKYAGEYRGAGNGTGMPNKSGRSNNSSGNSRGNGGSTGAGEYDYDENEGSQDSAFGFGPLASARTEEGSRGMSNQSERRGYGMSSEETELAHHNNGSHSGHNRRDRAYNQDQGRVRDIVNTSIDKMHAINSHGGREQQEDVGGLNHILPPSRYPSGNNNNRNDGTKDVQPHLKRDRSQDNSRYDSTTSTLSSIHTERTYSKTASTANITTGTYSDSLGFDIEEVSEDYDPAVDGSQVLVGEDALEEIEEESMEMYDADAKGEGKEERYDREAKYGYK